MEWNLVFHSEKPTPKCLSTFSRVPIKNNNCEQKKAKERNIFEQIFHSMGIYLRCVSISLCTTVDWHELKKWYERKKE